MTDAEKEEVRQWALRLIDDLLFELPQENDGENYD